MGPGEAAALPGHPVHTGAAAGAAGDGGPRRREDGPVHRGGAAHLRGGAGGRAGAAMPGLPLLPAGGPEEHVPLEVRPGPGGAAPGLGAPLSWVPGDPRQPVGVLLPGARRLSKRPRQHLQEVWISFHSVVFFVLGNVKRFLIGVRTVMENLEKSWNFKMVISRPGKVMGKT